MTLMLPLASKLVDCDQFNHIMAIPCAWIFGRCNTVSHLGHHFKTLLEPKIFRCSYQSLLVRRCTRQCCSGSPFCIEYFCIAPVSGSNFLTLSTSNVDKVQDVEEKPAIYHENRLISRLHGGTSWIVYKITKLRVFTRLVSTFL